MAKPRKQSQRNRDRLLISQYYLEGLTQWEIKKLVGCSQATVSRDLKVLQRYWQIKAIGNIDRVKAQELAKIDKLERTYWEAWRKSVGNKEIKTIESPSIEGKEGKTSILGREITKQWVDVGDKKYLDGVQWCINKRCEINGMDAPQKHEIAGEVKMSFIDLVKKVNGKDR